MQHTYIYDNLNRLDSAAGIWTNGSENATYNLGIEDDGMFNITNKNLSIFAQRPRLDAENPLLNERITYSYGYQYANNTSHQLTRLNESVDKNGTDYDESNSEKYTYDNNGNNILKATADKSGMTMYMKDELIGMKKSVLMQLV
jgi:hypothetical protein